MPESTLTLSFVDCAALKRELSANLTHGRAFVAGAKGPAVFSPCTLVLQHPENQTELRIPCEVVMVSDQGTLSGVALQFCDRGPLAQATLSTFVHAGDELLDEQDLSEADAHDRRDLTPDTALDRSPFCLRADPPASSPRSIRPNLSQERRERLRNLSPQARQKFAQSAILEERVQLERIYGSAVWELLLRNPKITVPEVATMARKGTMPRPLLELIADNELWIRQGVIRRALLGNPRLGMDSATKILRGLSAGELRLVPQQTAYPATVRQAAQRLTRGS